MLKRIHGSNSAALTYMQKAVNLYRLEFGIPVGFFISFSIEMMHCFYDHLIGKQGKLQGKLMKHENVLLIGCDHYFHFVRNLQSLVEDLIPMVLGVYVR